MGNSQSSGGGGKSGGMNYSITSCDGSTTKGKAYKFGDGTLLVSQSYPTSNNSSSSNWGNSTSNSGYSGGSSLSPQDQHIQSVNTALGGNVLGGAYHDGRKNRDMDDGINYQVKGIVQNLNYYGFKDPKGVVLSDCALEDKDIGVLVQSLQPHPFNLTILDLGFNKLGYYSIENIFYGMRGSQEGVTTHVCKQIRSINFSNNLLDDNSANYIAKSLEYGRFPSLKYLDVSGNNIGWEGNAKLAQMVQNIKQDIKVLVYRVLNVSTIIEGGKKQSDLFFGSKEEKQIVIKKYLQEAQSNGVDTKNVAVSKSIFDNKVKLGIKFLFGWAKCSVVPEDATSFAAGAIVAKTFKKATGVIAVTDVVACYFETFDESASSQEGIQYMLDAGYISQTDLLGNVE